MLGLYLNVPIACFRKGLAREYLETEQLPPPSTCYGFLLSLVGETDRFRHVGVRVTASLIGQPDLSVVLRTVWRVKTSNGWRGPNGRCNLLSDSEQKRFREWIRHRVAVQVESVSDAELPKVLDKLQWGTMMSEWLLQGRPEATSELGTSKERVKVIERWQRDRNEFVPVQGAGENARPDFQQLLSPVELVLWLDSRDEKESVSLEERVADVVVRKNYAAVTRFGGLSLGESTHLVNDVSHFIEDKEKRGKAFVLHPRGRMTLPVWVDHVGSAGTNFVTGNLQDGPLTTPEVDHMPCIQPRNPV